MNVLLLGGNGFLGRNLARGMASDLDFMVTVYDKMPPKEKINNVKYYEGGLEETGKLLKILEENSIEVFVHMVSTIIPGSTLEQYVNNCKLVQIHTIPLMDYCASHKIKLVYLSSGGTVYGVKGGVVSENEPTAPISYYGLSKVQIEELIYFYHRRYGLNYLILRPSNPFGYGQNLYGKQGLIAVMLGKLLKNEPIDVFGDGNTVRDYIYIEDFVYYVMELLRKGILNETINIGSGVGYSINEIVDIARKITGRQLNVNYFPARKDDVPKMVLDTTRLHNFIHHENISIEDGMKKFFNILLNEQTK